MKLAIIPLYNDKRLLNNGFFNLKPHKFIRELNGYENTITIDLLDGRKDKDEFIILSFSVLSIFDLLNNGWLFNIWKILRKFNNKKILLLNEPNVVAPIIYNKLFHKCFNYVLTFDERLVDGKKYFRCTFPLTLNPKIGQVPSFTEKKFLTLINGHKGSCGKDELYSWREKAIRYYENKMPQDFDLYGRGWDKPSLKQKLFGFKKYISYKGAVEDKILTLSKYKFNICFENQKNVPGYFTEKLRDSLQARSIPVYRGAENITEYLPDNCFIDFRKYMDFDELTNYLVNMDSNTYDSYIYNIDNFLFDKSLFDEGWAKTFLNTVKICLSNS